MVWRARDEVGARLKAWCSLRLEGADGARVLRRVYIDPIENVPVVNLEYTRCQEL